MMALLAVTGAGTEARGLTLRTVAPLTGSGATSNGNNETVQHTWGRAHPHGYIQGGDGAPSVPSHGCSAHADSCARGGQGSGEALRTSGHGFQLGPLHRQNLSRGEQLQLQ
jgi:hypothetical protein